MIDEFRRKFPKIDLMLLAFLAPILVGSLLVLYGFLGNESGIYFNKQLIWIAVSFSVMLVFSVIDVGVYKKTKFIATLYLVGISLLVLVLIFGKEINGAKGWFSFGSFSFQPSDFVKIILILVLAKYFSRRHIEIKRVKHIVISAVYLLIAFILILLEPDFGSAVVSLLIWLGISLVAGISKKHLLLLALVGATMFTLAWVYLFAPYQKERIINFVYPMADIKGTGYNAYQSVISVGSGGMFGKGVGFGNQSRLQYLPEHQTDFIFASFAEEWGFVGVLIILFCYLMFIRRVLEISKSGETNFETLFAVGYSILIMVHISVNIGMNVGVLPITGIPLPFMSYGGSNLISLFIGLGIIMSIKKGRKKSQINHLGNEFVT